MSTRMLAVLVFAYLGSTVAIAQQRTTVTIGETEYLISQRNADGRPLDYKYGNSISAHSGRCVLVFDSIYLEEEAAYLRFFGGWNQPDGPAEPLDGGGPLMASAMTSESFVVAGSGGYSWTDAQLFDLNGNSVASPVPVYQHYNWDRAAAASPVGDFFAIGGGGDDGAGDYGAVLRLLAPTGNYLSPPLPLWHFTGSAPGPLGIAVSTAGTIFVTFQDNTRRTRLERVDTSFNVSSLGTLDSRITYHGYPCAREDDVLCVVYDLEATGQGYVRTYNFDGVPLINPISLETNVQGAAFTPDGRFAVASDPVVNDELQVQLFNPDLTAVGPPVPFIIPAGIPPQRGYYEVRRPVAYEQDGTVWILWGGANGGPNHPDGETPMYLTQMKPFLRGDMNADGVVDNSDIDPFVLALLDPAAFDAQFPGLPYQFYGDMNRDGVMDNSDIDGFVARLLQ